MTAPSGPLSPADVDAVLAAEDARFFSRSIIDAVIEDRRHLREAKLRDRTDLMKTTQARDGLLDRHRQLPLRLERPDRLLAHLEREQRLAQQFDLPRLRIRILPEEQGGVPDGADAHAAALVGDLLAHRRALVAIGPDEAELNEFVGAQEFLQFGEERLSQPRPDVQQCHEPRRIQPAAVP